MRSGIYFSNDRFDSYSNPDETGVVSMTFNEGSTVTMKFNSSFLDDYDNPTKLFAPTLTVGGQVQVPTKIDDGLYKYTFENLQADQNVVINYAEAETINVKANFDNDDVWVNLDGRDINPGADYMFAQNSNMILIVPEKRSWNNNTGEWVRYFPTVTVTEEGGDPVVIDLEKIPDTDSYNCPIEVTDKDITLAIAWVEAPKYTITASMEDYKGMINFSGNGFNGDIYTSQAVSFYEGSNVEMVIPKECEVWDNQTYRTVKYYISFTVDGQAPDENDYTTDEWDYRYTFSNLAANHTVALVYEKAPSVTVNYVANWLEVNLNDDYLGSGESRQYNKGDNVTLFVDVYNPENCAFEKITQTIDGVTTDINYDPVNDDPNNGYTIENIQKDVVFTVITGWKIIRASFKEGSKGKFYFTTYSDEDEDRWASNYETFTKGKKVKLSIVPSVGYDVASVTNTIDGQDVTNKFTYDSANKEWSWLIDKDELTDSYSFEITTTKKVPEPGQTVQCSVVAAATGKGTFCSEYDLDFSNVTDIKAYIASGFNPATGNIVLTRVTEVPAGTGLYVKSVSGGAASCDVPTLSEPSYFYYSNMLKGIVEATFIDRTEWNWVDNEQVECRNYYLTSGDIGIAFYPSGGTTLGANKAYLPIPLSLIPQQANHSRGIGVEFDDEDNETTFINDIQANEVEGGDYYNLNGQKVQNPGKGVYVKNGKKVIIR